MLYLHSKTEKVMKTFKSIEQLNKAIVKNNGQLNLDILLNQRANLGKGWEYFNLNDEVRKQVIDEVVNVLGGWNKHKGRIKFTLNNVPLSHWGLQRIIFDGTRWRYVAGQDYVNELRIIRAYIRA